MVRYIPCPISSDHVNILRREGSPIILTLNLQPQKLYKDVHELIRMAFPEYEIHDGQFDGADLEICIQLEENAEQVTFTASVKNDLIVTEDKKTYHLNLHQTKQVGRLTRLFVYNLLCQHLARNINPYGILSGVRPVKIVHRWMDQGKDDQAIIELLQSDYLMEKDKAELLTEIALNNRPYLHSRLEAGRKISIYIGIPFCPSRCYYCSFPGAILQNYDTELKPFLQVLKREMDAIGDCIQDLKLEVDNIYIGGGTPTVLQQTDMGQLFELLHKKFISPASREITVEAGRPDTLSPSILQFMQKNGVNRICINPQTMHDDSLKLIGRNHQEADIERTVDWARAAEIQNINMDLIVGLPGEGLAENIITAEKVLALHPDNITVHSLAVKKGSRLAEMEGKSGLNYRVQEAKAGIDYFQQCMASQGYLPYYLYRQKYMKASLENIGYSRPDHFCCYNIQVMEERQTIIGMGGGASSKFVNPGDWTLTNLHNPKDPLSYCRTVDTLLARKVDKLRALN